MIFARHQNTVSIFTVELQVIFLCIEIIYLGTTSHGHDQKPPSLSFITPEFHSDRPVNQRIHLLHSVTDSLREIALIQADLSNLFHYLITQNWISF